MDADRTPSLLQRCWVVDGKQPSGKIKVLYDSAVQKLLDEVGPLSLLDAANKSEWHNTTRPEALAAQARAASGVSAQVAAKRPSQAAPAVTKGAASSTSESRAAASGASVTASATCKPESRRNLKPTKPAIETDRKRKILITDKCTMAFKKWREKGESFRVDRYRRIEGRSLHQIMSAKTKVTKTKTALKQETYNRHETNLQAVQVFLPGLRFCKCPD
jgi:hypothetical protein